MAVEIELQEEVGEPPAPAKEEGERNRNGAYLYYLGMVVAVIGFASCVMQLQFHGTVVGVAQICVIHILSSLQCRRQLFCGR